eukprot:TRINITY_DN11789_c0_g1_i2.p4 TRINITY_DN11789_c0_g1~~TRINITY_DN11789_c0_g1_i2.p4  ORF type:complete len:114 (-),score=18.62 TRINITY_DN11789_c0_g1_i2:17-358(-)
MHSSNFPYFITNTYLNRPKKSIEVQTGKKVYKSQEMYINEGFGYFYLKNDSEKGFHMSIKLKKMEGLKLRKPFRGNSIESVSYTHLRAHETGRNLVCRLLLEKKKKNKKRSTC